MVPLSINSAALSRNFQIDYSLFEKEVFEKLLSKFCRNEIGIQRSIFLRRSMVPGRFATYHDSKNMKNTELKKTLPLIEERCKTIQFGCYSWFYRSASLIQ